MRKISYIAAASLFGLAACVQQYPPPPPPPPPLGYQSFGPAYGTIDRYCDRNALIDVFQPTTANILGSAAGAAAGGLLGSQIGRSSGNTAATITGILAGALVGGAIARSMQPVDHACIDEGLEHTPIGDSIGWQNPGNSSSYWLTPTRTSLLPDGTPCRTYTMDALVNGHREAQTGYACRQADGTWRNMY